MSGIPCRYYDGRTSQRRDAALTLLPGGGLVVAHSDADERLVYRSVRLPDRIADTPRFVHLPDGGLCEVLDNDALDAAQARARSGNETRAVRFGRLRHRLDSTWRGAAAALAVTAAILYSFTEWGAAALATVAVSATPPEVEAVIGENALSLLEQIRVLNPSGLPPDRRNELLAGFEAMRAEAGVEDADLRFHAVGVPNAFALPGGAIVLTDELVALAENDEEIVAVLAHELGHVAGRHAMRRLAQTSSMLVLWTAFTGDVSVAALSFLGPDRLLAQRYSRSFERDADRFAFDYLLDAGISPTRLGDILERLGGAGWEEGAGAGGNEDAGAGGSNLLDWLSSHPGAAERARNAAEAAERARDGAEAGE